MVTKTQTLSTLPDIFALCRLNSDDAIPHWATAGSFYSITRTSDELSIFCSQANVPAGVTCDRGWRCLKIEGPFDLNTPGVLVSVAAPLAQAGMSLFAVATYDTDYLLVKELDRAVQVLAQAGHRVLA